MKADCPNCKHYHPRPAEQIWQGMPIGDCDAPACMTNGKSKRIYELAAVNCGGIGFERKSIEVDNGDNGIRISVKEDAHG